MTDKSAFTDEEWHAITDAPLLVTMAIFAAGEHGPISMVKEASASARSIAQPGDRGDASELIAQIAAEAESKEARHDMKEHRGKDIDSTIASALADLEPAATAIHAKTTAIEAAEVAGWLIDIAQAVAQAAKTVNPKEQETIEKITALFRVSVRLTRTARRCRQRAVEVSTIRRLDGLLCESLLGTLPRTNRRTPVMPRLPTTSRSHPVSLATVRSASAASPGTQCDSAVTPSSFARSTAWSQTRCASAWTRLVRLADRGRGHPDLARRGELVRRRDPVRADDVQRRAAQARQLHRVIDGDGGAGRSVRADNDLLVHRSAPRRG